VKYSTSTAYNLMRIAEAYGPGLSAASADVSAKKRALCQTGLYPSTHPPGAPGGGTGGIHYTVTNGYMNNGKRIFSVLAPGDRQLAESVQTNCFQLIFRLHL